MGFPLKHRMETVKLNIGGTLFETYSTTLTKYPDTLLGTLATSSVHYDSKRKVYFFDRNSDFFSLILDFYRSGILHLPPSSCGVVIRQELEFWQIPQKYIGECCIQRYMKFESDVETRQQIKQAFEDYDLDYSEEECRKSLFKRLLRKLWLTLEEPAYSVFAKVFHYLFLVIVLLSITTFILGSHPNFRQQKLTYNELLYLKHHSNIKFFNELDIHNSKQIMIGSSLPNKVLMDIELFCTSFFSLEFLLRFLSCPKKLTFFKNLLNITDVVLLSAMWITFGLEQDLGYLVKNWDLLQFYLFSKSLVVLRLLRMLRLTKLSGGLKILIMSFRASLKDLLLLCLTFLLTAIFFASFVFYAEFREPNTFPNIFAGIWWAFITMTTVGYGDMYPTSIYGKVVGIACAFSGMLILAMPVAIVATNFGDYHEKYKLRRMQQSKMPTKHSTQKHKIQKVLPFEESVHERKSDISYIKNCKW